MYKCMSCNWTGYNVKSKNIKKIPTKVCPDCKETVQKYDIPLTERIGRCSNCGHGAFMNAIVRGDLLRCCKKCLEVRNIDKDMLLVREGKQHEMW